MRVPKESTVVWKPLGLKSSTRGSMGAAAGGLSGSLQAAIIGCIYESRGVEGIVNGIGHVCLPYSALNRPCGHSPGRGAGWLFLPQVHAAE